MPFCIPKEFIDDVKNIVSTTSSSIKRNKQLTEMFGAEGAKTINTAYEKSLLLKNQGTALDKFIANFTELGQAQKQELKVKIAQRMADKTTKIQNEELLSLAQDIWNKKYKLDLSLEDVAKINDLKIQIDNLKDKMTSTPVGSIERDAYGQKMVELKHIVEDLKNPREKLGFIETAKGIAKETASRFDKEKGILGNVGEGIKVVGEAATSAIYKSVQASADLSYSLRQGFKVFTKSPKVWAQNWKAAFEPFKHITKEEQQKVADAFMAKMVSHPLYQKAIDSKLAIGVIEDFFPTTLAEKIPGVGSIFKASNEAFTIFSQGSRLGLFEDMYRSAMERGIPESPQLLKNIAELSNSLTGRGHLGALEKNSGVVNKIFYSGRYIKSSIDTFWKPFDPKLDPFTRGEAMKSSIATIGTMGTLMYTASLFTDVEWNPLSSKFGKAKVPGSKDTWVDLTAGMGSYITTASKIAFQKTKSSTTGKITELNKRDKKGNIVYGSETVFDVGINWMSNKLSPAPSTIVQFMKGSDYQGNKPTFTSAAINLMKPIAVGNVWQTIMSDSDESAKLVTSVADILGANQTNYSQFKK